MGPDSAHLGAIASLVAGFYAFLLLLVVLLRARRDLLGARRGWGLVTLGTGLLVARLFLDLLAGAQGLETAPAALAAAGSGCILGGFALVVRSHREVSGPGGD